MDQGRVTYRWVGGEGRVMAHHSANDRSTAPVSRVPPVKAPSPYFTIVLIQLSWFKKRSRGLSKWPIKITRALWLSEDLKNGGSSKTNHSVSVTSMSGVGGDHINTPALLNTVFPLISLQFFPLVAAESWILGCGRKGTSLELASVNGSVTSNSVQTHGL